MDSALPARGFARIVQMLWDPEPANDTNLDLPVWCMGRSYRLKSARDPSSTTISGSEAHVSPVRSEVPQDNHSTSDGAGLDTPCTEESNNARGSLASVEPYPGNGWPLDFMQDFSSRLWMTYRSDFEPIPRSNDPKAASSLSLSMRIRSHLIDQGGFTSDSGWGCMIRSGQSLLANAMALNTFGRDWRRTQPSDDEKQLIALFADDPRAPYSIHRFVRHGAKECGKYPGQWFGPSATAQCIRALTNGQAPSLRVYSTGGSPEVHEDKFMAIARPSGQVFHPTLILVGTRLGTEKITGVYWDALLASLHMKQSVGIVGGRPSSSYYFIGTQGPHLFYLDPHHTRRALPYHEDPREYTDADIDSCYTSRLRRIHVSEMDPSMLIGFLIQDEDDWSDWKASIGRVVGRKVLSLSDQTQNNLLSGMERAGAIDEVESLSDGEDDITILDVNEGSVIDDNTSWPEANEQ